MSEPKKWGGRRIARPGKKIGRPASPEQRIRKNLYLTQTEWNHLHTLSPSPSAAIRTLIKQNKEQTK